MAKVDIGFQTRGALVGLRRVNDELYTDDVLTAVGAKKIDDTTSGGGGGATGAAATEKPLFGVVAKYLAKIILTIEPTGGGAGGAGGTTSTKRKTRMIRCSPEKIGDAYKDLPGKTVDGGTVLYVRFSTDRSFN